MTASLAETVLFWRATWPSPYCGTRGEHGFDRYPTYFVCAYCGAPVLPEDLEAIERWWQNFHWRTIVYERN